MGNPFESLSDALTEWKQRLDVIESDETAQKEQEVGDEDADKENDDNIDSEQYAMVPDDVKVDNEEQALMDNDNNEQDQIHNIYNKEDDEDNDMNDNNQFDDDDDEEYLHQNSDEDDDKFDPYQKQTNAQKQEDDEENKNDIDSKQNKQKIKDLRIKNEEESEQSYLDYLQQLISNDNDTENESDDDNDIDMMNINNMNTDKLKKENDTETKQEEHNDENEEDGPTAVEIAELRNNLDLALSRYGGGGDEIWRKLCLVTTALSQQLCEELRTILEPLTMSKLGGDFRSGKRINMKRVIPFIASSFRKDRIWLRRCKPHKRNYRILICIDDSQSMRENCAGRLALESLCILTRALNKLEVGQIGVLSFGQSIKLLHSLQKPFCDESGSFVCSQFSFAQKETKYHDLIATIINVLSNSDATWKNIKRHIEDFTNCKSSSKYSLPPTSSSWDGSETLSLVFIISDARIQQNRNELEQLVRIAHARKQIVLMLIVDTKDEKTSITNIQSIHVDEVTNRVRITKYLDDFPFPYYVLLKNIETLPNVVADSLRQWFELVRQSS